MYVSPPSSTRDVSHSLSTAPRWLLTAGRHVEAQRVIAALADDKYDGEATLLQTRLIMQTIAQSKAMGVQRKRELFTGGPTQHCRRMLLGASSQIFQQLGGCNAIIYFAPVVRFLVPPLSCDANDLGDCRFTKSSLDSLVSSLSFLVA
mgnify:CR=1 FL=1